MPQSALDRRHHRLDALRTLAMVWMTVFHFSFDLNHFRLIPPQQFLLDPFWTWQRTAIVSLFLFTAGLSQAVALHGQGLLQRPVAARLAIRPEAISLHLDGELDGQVNSHSLLGNVIRYRVQVRGVELVVDVLNRSSADLHADGQRVSLSIDPTALREVA